MSTQPPPRKRVVTRPSNLGVILVVAGALLGLLGLMVLTNLGSTVQGQRDQAVTQRDGLAQDRRVDATTITALCASGGEVAAALDAAGQCGRARQALVNPVVASSTTPPATPEPVAQIVAQVRAQVPTPAPLDQVVDAVVARIQNDPELHGLSPDDVRAIVAAMIAQNPPRSGKDGTSFGGLAFVRQDGKCVAVVRLVDGDGDVHTQTTPVADAACGPSSLPATEVPERTGEPAPAGPTTTAAPPSDAPAPTGVPAPAQTGDSGDGGLLGGLLGG